MTNVFLEICLSGIEMYRRYYYRRFKFFRWSFFCSRNYFCLRCTQAFSIFLDKLLPRFTIDYSFNFWSIEFWRWLNFNLLKSEFKFTKLKFNREIVSRNYELVLKYSLRLFHSFFFFLIFAIRQRKEEEQQRNNNNFQRYFSFSRREMYSLWNKMEKGSKKVVIFVNPGIRGLLDAPFLALPIRCRGFITPRNCSAN